MFLIEGRFNGKDYITKDCESVAELKTKPDLKEKDIRADNCIALDVEAPDENNQPTNQMMTIKACFCSSDL